jgi:hypothetical protein
VKGRSGLNAPFLQCRLQPFFFIAESKGPAPFSPHTHIRSNLNHFLARIELLQDRRPAQYSRRFAALPQHLRDPLTVLTQQPDMHATVALHESTMPPFTRTKK